MPVPARASPDQRRRRLRGNETRAAIDGLTFVRAAASDERQREEQHRTQAPPFGHEASSHVGRVLWAALAAGMIGRVQGQADLFQRIARFEHDVGDGGWDWLGGPRGLALGLGMSVAMVPVTILLGYVAFGSAGDADTDSSSGFGGKICGTVWLLMMTALGAYWKRQRLAGHFQSAHRRLWSADPDERQRALTDLMINARRGWGEHRRIAHALCEYLRRAPEPHPERAAGASSRSRCSPIKR